MSRRTSERKRSEAKEERDCISNELSHIDPPPLLKLRRRDYTALLRMFIPILQFSVALEMYLPAVSRCAWFVGAKPLIVSDEFFSNIVK